MQKHRLRWPHHVLDDVLGVSPCEEELSQKERKKRKEVAKRKEMETMSMDWPADDEARHEPEKNGKYARLEEEIISLRKKLVKERKRNQDLQDVVVKGMEKLLKKACCNCYQSAAEGARANCTGVLWAKGGGPPCCWR